MINFFKKNVKNNLRYYGSSKDLVLFFEEKDWSFLKEKYKRAYFYEKKYYLKWSLNRYDNLFEVFSEAWFAEENKRMLKIEYWKFFENPYVLNSKEWLEENRVRKLDIFKKNQEDSRRYFLLFSLYSTSLKNFLGSSFNIWGSKRNSLFLRVLNDETDSFFLIHKKGEFLKSNTNLSRKFLELSKNKGMLFSEPDIIIQPYNFGLDIRLSRNFLLRNFFIKSYEIFSVAEDEIYVKKDQKKENKVINLKDWEAQEYTELPDIFKPLNQKLKKIKKFYSNHRDYLFFKFFKIDFNNLIRDILKFSRSKYEDKVLQKYTFYEKEKNRNSFFDRNQIKLLGIQRFKESKSTGNSFSVDFEEESERTFESIFEEEEEDFDRDFSFNFDDSSFFKEYTMREIFEDHIQKFELFLVNNILRDRKLFNYILDLGNKYKEIKLNDDLVFGYLSLIKNKEVFREIITRKILSNLFFNDSKIMCFEKEQDLCVRFVEDTFLEKKLSLDFRDETKKSTALSDIFENQTGIEENLFDGLENAQILFIFGKLDRVKQRGKVIFFRKYLEFLDTYFELSTFFRFGFKKNDIRKKKFSTWFFYGKTLMLVGSEESILLKDFASYRMDLYAELEMKWDKKVYKNNVNLYRYNLEFYSKVLKDDGSFNFSSDKMYFTGLTLYLRMVSFLRNSVYVLKNVIKQEDEFDGKKTGKNF